MKMPDQSHRKPYTSADDRPVAAPQKPSQNGHHSVLKPYTPPGVPHGLPHVVNFATISSIGLPIQVRFLVTTLARFANHEGTASVAVVTLGEICSIGSKNTVERWLEMTARIGILAKEPNKGGKDRKSNSYRFLGRDRNWLPLPVGHPNTNPVIALAEARLTIERLLMRGNLVEGLQAEVEELRAEIAQLRNGGSIGHSPVTDGPEEPDRPTPNRSLETPLPETDLDNPRAIGHSPVTDGPSRQSPDPASDSQRQTGGETAQQTAVTASHLEVTNGNGESKDQEDSHSYESETEFTPEGHHEAIGHSMVTDGPEIHPKEGPDSYESETEFTPEGHHEAIGHSIVTDGPGINPQEGPDSYLDEGESNPEGHHGAIGHSEVTDGFQEGQEYLARRDRVEALVQEHRRYYARSFNRRGILGAIEFFSRTEENEQELLRQIRILNAGNEPEDAEADPTDDATDQQEEEAKNRYGVGACPDCRRPFGTYGGARYCTDCTERRRRESEA